jgi:glycosyltransferase involved in cell wall biosynthesis
MLAVALTALLLAGFPAFLCMRNLRLYRPPPDVDEIVPQSENHLPQVSVLIPARNEERTIRNTVAAVQANGGVDLEIIVMDDHSEDQTAAIIGELAERDARVRIETAPSLPPGWNGKQHACYTLSKIARHPILVFLDADVKLSPTAIRRMAAFLERSKADLISGFPREETGTIWEKMIIPLIHFLLLSYLPLARMRKSTSPMYAAGCGQLFMARREAYEGMQGHAAIKSSMHDGIKLPHAFRKAGLTTDLFDATPIATCRMYRNGREVWNGFTKNATEGMGSPGAIAPWTLLLFGGQVLPVLLLFSSFFTAIPTAVLVCAVFGSALAYSTRLLLAIRFRQSLLGAMLHPAGIMLVLAMQWVALVNYLTGKPTSWKGRQQRLNA